MDTDELTEAAYDVIVHAARISDTLKSLIGVLAGRCLTEDEWLRKVRANMMELAADPDEFVEAWSLEEAEGVDAGMLASGAVELSKLVDEILAMSM